MMANEGDIVIIDESLEYSYFRRRYKALVIFNGFNNQPLITRLGGWKPQWSSYSQIAEIVGHIDLGKLFEEVNNADSDCMD